MDPTGSDGREPVPFDGVLTGSRGGAVVASLILAHASTDSDPPSP
jgi:hypothetical protein